MGERAWVCAGISEEVEIYQDLGYETIPLLEGKVGTTRSESGAKMIFECADRTFGGVASVGVQGNKLKFNVVLAKVFMHGVGELFVKNVESGGCTMLL